MRKASYLDFIETAQDRHRRKAVASNRRPVDGTYRVYQKIVRRLNKY